MMSVKKGRAPRAELSLPALDLMAAGSPLTAAKGLLGPEQTLTTQKVARVLKLKAAGRVMLALADIALVGEGFHMAGEVWDDRDWRRFCQACKRMGLDSDPDAWGGWPFRPQEVVLRAYKNRLRGKARLLDLDASREVAKEILAKAGDAPRKPLVKDGTTFKQRVEALTTVVLVSSQQMAYERETS
jgi:hypothetical protein